jgi:acetyl esterase
MPKLAPGVEDYIAKCEQIEPGSFNHVIGEKLIDSNANLPIDKFRQIYLALFRCFPCPKLNGISISDVNAVLESHRIPMRIFKPKLVNNYSPCIIYAHGGGFLAGDLEASDGIAADLAERLNLVVITFHYRLAPEFHYPKPLEDCYEVLCFVKRNATRYGVNPERLIFAGESSGGNLAAAVCLLARDRGRHTLFAQVLINPVLNVHRWAYREVDTCPESFSHEMRYFTATYLGENTNVLPEYASPLLANDLSQLPPALIWAAEVDPLSEEAEMFSDKLKAAGVPSQLHIHKGVVHGCLRARHHYRFAEEAFDALCDGIKNLLKHPRVHYTITSCSLGYLLVAASEQGICAVNFSDTQEQLEKMLLTEFSEVNVERNDFKLANVVQDILQYLEGKQIHFIFPLDLQGTIFQKQVWQALQAIPYGERRSYKEIAATISKPSAIRAVANACASNRVAILVPCHRVIREDGSCSGYHWGVNRKKKLLELERAKKFSDTIRP